jgi:WD40 repeat protein
MNIRYLICYLFVVLSFSRLFAQDTDWQAITPDNADELQLVETIDLNALLGTEDYDAQLHDLSADGRYLSVYLSSSYVLPQFAGALIVLDLYTQELVFNLELPQEEFPIGLWDIAISTDGRWLAFFMVNDDESSSLRLYEIESRSLIHGWDGLSQIGDIEFSQDNRYLAFSNKDVLLVWSLESSETFAEIELRLDAEKSEEAPAIAFSPDSQWIALATGLQFRLYDLADLSEILVLEKDSQFIRWTIDLIFLSDASKILWMDATGEVYLVDIGAESFETLGTNSAYFAGQIEHHQPRNVFGFRASEEMNFLDLSSMTLLSSVDIGTVYDTSLDGELAAAQADLISFDEIVLIAVSSGDILAEFTLPEAALRTIYISPNSDYIAVVGLEGNVYLYVIER